MPFASGGNHDLSYIKETSFGNAPATAMRKLRHTSCSLVLSKDTFQSGELRSDAQISDLRHGVKQVGGDVGFELSYGEYDDFLAAAVRGSWSNNVLVAGTTMPTFSFERVFSDINQYQVFTGCAVDKLSLDVKTNAMITGTMTFVGKKSSFPTSARTPSPTAATANPPLDGFNGTLKEGNSIISVVTGLSLSIENGIETANVIGSDEAAQLVPSRINITGSISAYFENMTLLNKFVNETESSLEVVLGTGGDGSYTLLLPRIKYTGGSNPTDGEGPVMLDMPFQALLDKSTATNIKITRVPTGSTASLSLDNE